MRGLNADSEWTHLIAGMAIAGAGSGLVSPPLASTAVGVAPPHRAGMASGINSTFRQVGTAVAVAVLGLVFTADLNGAGATTQAAQYATALNEVLIVAALVAFVAAGLALALIRPRDFHSAGAGAARKEPAATGQH